MKKIVLLISILLLTLSAYAQSTILDLPKEVDSIELVIPAKWKLLSKATGDLNQDGIEDLAVAIVNTDERNIRSNPDGVGRDSINLNPRILGVYFGTKDRKLIKKLQADRFILLQDSPTMDDPFKCLEITDNGLLRINFHFWYSAGSWFISWHTYEFRFQNDKFELIGYKSSERHRATGETTDYKIDFMTSKITILKMMIDDRDLEIITEDVKTFKIDQLKSIESLGKPFEWEFDNIRL